MAGDGEFDFIRRHLVPLSEGDPVALGLTDDAALLDPAPGESLVLACDTLIAGVHFRDKDTPQTVASRALRSNLSDLAAMGASPRHYLAALSWPRSLDAKWREAFLAGLHREQSRFGLALVGGDTTATPGPLTISLTLIGAVPSGAALTRSGACAGEDVWISGQIGDGFLGLMAAETGAESLAECLIRYTAPEPRLALGEALRGVASSAIDISDGLIADLGHIARTSGCGLDIEIDAVPLSSAGSAWLASPEGDVLRLLAGGDDYELAFTAAPGDRARIDAIGAGLDLPLTRIGRVAEGSGIQLRNGLGEVVAPDRGGFTHF
ncbi:thiamine-phosphate kinase [uncultured Maricaulis sp.]|uniref:thiamine-phosphate kinase n=1 Tax=uncultured Maricaulis sp. TaxID=174710 RepID=UPI00262CA92F|nr:thiamine-phosphate kinase [uncultured Maricaulis sp.]